MALDFEALFEEHYDVIASYLRRRLVDVSTADDLAALTFLEAYDRRATYDPGRGTPRAWLFGIARNLLGHHLRAQQRQRRAYKRAASQEVVPPGVADELCREIDARAKRDPIAAALAKLSDGDRAVVMLRCWTELTYEEISTVLRIPVGTVKSRLNRACMQLRDLLGPDILEGDHG